MSVRFGAWPLTRQPLETVHCTHTDTQKKMQDNLTKKKQTKKTSYDDLTTAVDALYQPFFFSAGLENVTRYRG